MRVISKKIGGSTTAILSALTELNEFVVITVTG
jgi:hypothetical protein